MLREFVGAVPGFQRTPRIALKARTPSAAHVEGARTASYELWHAIHPSAGCRNSRSV